MLIKVNAKYKTAAKNKNSGSRVEPAAIYDCLIISTKPVTEIKEVSFSVICQTLLKLES